MVNTREVLEQGLERIKKGWFQGPPGLTNMDDANAQCAITAVEGTMRTTLAYELLHQHLPAGHEHRSWAAGCLVRWNNAIGRTQDEIIELYKAAIVDSPLEEKT